LSTLTEIILFQSPVLFPLTVAIIRFKKLPRVYRPFAYLMMIAAITEVLNTYLAFHIRTNTYSQNSYLLFEGILIMFLFKNWGLFKNAEKFFRGFLTFYICFHLIYYFAFGLINTWYSHFAIFHAFAMVIMTINYLNKLISNPEGNLLKDPRFIICMGFLFFFTFSCTMNAFYVFNMDLPDVVRHVANQVFRAINITGNIFYGIALLIVPEKKDFILENEISNLPRNNKFAVN
jgi:hypothetical protein